MPIENFDEVKTYFETNKENDEVKAFVSGLSPITVDRIKSLVDMDKDIKSWLDSEKDKHASKSLETWKTNNLEKLVDEEFKKKYPQKSDKDMELEKLKTEIENIKKEATRKELVNKALKFATEKHLPVELVDYFVSADEETTTNNLFLLEKIFNTQVEAQINERLKGGYQPPKDDKGGKAFTMEDLKKMSPEEINAHWNEIQNSLGKK